MRRLFGFIILCSSLILPVAGAASAEPVNAVPSVVIYPFGQTADVPAKTGLYFAQIFAQVIGSRPGAKVAAIGENVKRADYLTYAKSENADYYIAGYLTPIGGGAAVVVQIVDVNTGIIKYTQSQQTFNINDIGALALTTRTAIIGAWGEETPGSRRQPERAASPRILSDTGHFIMAGSPVETNAALRAFATQIDPE